ncbi:MAG: hypothetical protein R3F07_13675 [Opitutaceae bacterium]
MSYVEFRDSIQADLKRSPSGKTWKELQQSLNLPYKRPCPEWVGRLEREIGLLRDARRGSALVWRVALP